jgi:hypothetical protein
MYAFVIPAKAHYCPGKFFAVLAGKLKRRHFRESALLSGEIFAVLAGKLKRRHSSESWNPAT